MLEDQKQPSRDEQPGVKTILVVEDDEDIGEALLFALNEESSYHVIVVATGSEALQIARDRKINLFIVDYYLSDINGIELYDKLHAIPELQDVPVLLVSVNIEHLEQQLRVRHLMGLGKPFDLDKFLEVVAKALV
jgi:CheY-like chemotaxis protein